MRPYWRRRAVANRDKGASSGSLRPSNPTAGGAAGFRILLELTINFSALPAFRHLPTERAGGASRTAGTRYPVPGGVRSPAGGGRPGCPDDPPPGNYAQAPDAHGGPSLDESSLGESRLGESDAGRSPRPDRGRVILAAAEPGAAAGDPWIARWTARQDARPAAGPGEPAPG